MTTKTHQFVAALVERAPGLAPVLHEHLKDNRELLSHLFLGDVTRYVVAWVTGDTPAATSTEARAVLRFLEDAYAEGDGEFAGIDLRVVP